MDYGALLGHTLGNLRGTATAAIALMSLPILILIVGEKRTGILEELKIVITKLYALHFEMKFPEGCDDHVYPINKELSEWTIAKVDLMALPIERFIMKRKPRMEALKERLHLALQDWLGKFIVLPELRQLG